MRDIIILEKDKNKKGDLFNRLVFDVFHALGFGDPHYNVHKSGRELDIVLEHRTESKFAFVESKARDKKTGGDEINKFVGALNVEKGKYEAEGNSLIGYFISRLGFTETAITQENERKQNQGNKNEIILLGPSELVRELIKGNMLCSFDHAVSVSASTIKDISNNDLKLCSYADLIAHDSGWIWVLYYSAVPKQIATHFALVHADGNPLLSTISDSIISASQSLGTPLSKITYLKPQSKAELNRQVAKEAYYKYLENELGEIQFEGMPTDKDAGAVKINLENIFVPLRFEYADDNTKTERFTDISGVLSKSHKAAILAKPGGGKSTLIRRMALAYAFPERRLRVDDGLPDENWFPIYIRCRDLGDNATKSIMEIICSVVTRAEITEYSHEFESLTKIALQEGNALLLVDGLDEISSENNRVRFSNQLRTFVATYPNVHLIITSRVAGFRAVAGTLASYCEQYSIADFNKKQISTLSDKWHQAVMGDSGNPEEESRKVCDIIFGDRRIMVLAGNPLLLTTLLFVKRWIGYLPTKKCQLYDKMIELLLVTWNAAAHDKLDRDETEPQLAYIAYSMTIKGTQKINKDDLIQCIKDVRKSLSDLLGYRQVSPSEFIDQVEERSSLLIQVGLEKNENGLFVPSYEFSHLSFQEYLTAKAIAKEWVNALDKSTPLDFLKPYINEEHWKEVIPLTAVLLERRTKDTVEYLLKLSEDLICESDLEDKQEKIKQLAPFHLANCIASEVPMNQELLEKSIIVIVKCRDIIDNQCRKIIDIQRFVGSNFGFDGISEIILKSKYGGVFYDTVKNTITNRSYQNYLSKFMNTLAGIEGSHIANNLNLIDMLRLLESKEHISQVIGTLQMMHFSYLHVPQTHSTKKPKPLHLEDNETIKRIFNIILDQLKEDDEILIYSASWCIGWSGYAETNIIPETLVPLFAHRLFELWTNPDHSKGVKRMISWGVFSICAPYLTKSCFEDIENIISITKMHLESPKNDFDHHAALNMAVLMEMLSEKELEEFIVMNNAERYIIRRESFKYLESQGIDIEKIMSNRTKVIRKPK